MEDGMANNYGDGYQAGLRGEAFSGSGAQEYAGYAAGQEVRARSQPKTNIDGVSFTALALAIPICIIYPIAGSAALGAVALTWKGAEWTGMLGSSPWVLPFMLLMGLVAFFPGFAVEKRLAHGRMYRILRDVYRIGLAALIPINMLMTTGRNPPDGGLIAFAIVIIPIGYWLLKRIDRAVGAAGAP
jgi:hypothetical protein